MVGCAPVHVKILLSLPFFVLKIRGEDASDMQNPSFQYNILNKDIILCKNSEDYVGFSYPEIGLTYTICPFHLMPYY